MSRGDHWLRPDDFEIFIDKVVIPYCSIETYAKIKRCHHVYEIARTSLNAKINPHRGTDYISRSNINPYFDNLIQKTNYTLANILSDEDAFAKFSDDTLGIPANSGLQRDAINNGYIICEFFIAEMRKSNRGRLKDLALNKFPAYLSHVARTAGWASQMVSQERKFDYFMSLTEEQAKSGDRHSIICFNMLKRHDFRRQFFNTGLIDKNSTFASVAYDAWRQLPEGPLCFLESHDKTLLMNPVDEMIMLGAGSNFVMEKMNSKSIEYILDSSAEISSSDTYEKSSIIVLEELKAESYLNNGDKNGYLTAHSKIARARAMLQSSKNLTTNYGTQFELSRIEGILMQKMFNIEENYRLIEARDIALKVGSIPRARLIERIMGWK